MSFEKTTAAGVGFYAARPGLVERLMAALAVDRPWQRITDRDRAALYFRARALAMLADAGDPEAQAALVEREEAETLRQDPDYREAPRLSASASSARRASRSPFGLPCGLIVTPYKRYGEEMPKRAKEPEPHRCARCGVDLDQPRSPRRRYCGDACRQAAYRDRLRRVWFAEYEAGLEKWPPPRRRER